MNRRLALLSALCEPLQEAVREGVVSTWAANRVFVPLARANSADAERLLGQVRREPLSSRQLATWLDHYRQGNRTVRERLLAHRRLFVQSLERTSGNEDPPPDPEGQWLAELERVGRKLAQLRRALTGLLSPSPPPQTWQNLGQAVSNTAQALERLRQPLQEGHDARRTPTSDHPRTACEGEAGIRQISRTLGHSRHTVRKVLSEGSPLPPRPATSAPPALTSPLPELFCKARGNVVRIQEMRREHHDLQVPYSTLT